jgi:uncharacterized protein YecT (DUF1311 family)
MLIGTWDVQRVLVDGQDQMHWEYRPDTPEYLGRQLVVAQQEVRFNGSVLGCKQDRWVPHRVTWADLIQKAFKRSPDGGRSPHPTLVDFDLKISPKVTTTVYVLCPRPHDREANFAERTWVAASGPDQIALRLDTSGLFLLTRRSPSARPTPSFPCAKASTPVEKTICGDFALAAWDRSVAIAWRGATEGTPEKAESLREEQKVWLQKRDQCGNNAECLTREMIQRTRDLSRQYRP